MLCLENWMMIMMVYYSLDEVNRANKIIDEQFFDGNGFIDYEDFLLALHPSFDDTQDWKPKIFQKIKLFDQKKEKKRKTHRKQ